ncbi:tRNA uridine-5-carboxymethylaminomethyl(34) synthesis GTPase MnmE [Novosphingobium sp. Leaf2]|uniref:tRNA uridine-5-carboxymethylaminomethyl(34) synthesis GTPase MnmE n=1 Tax=Novosphingobium sp. Leaf2 TaxID=1735670 RepID=UPI0006F245FA|nr:tRNA uridine-5-carboxymethylaminomethyl(34) synthesis GTPase MnmE [Novosphingobium sp. Leaf2]KQM21849.1 tRNA modification GTPase TrmE [Novosphingobium sp. Leaf2]
MNDTIFALSSGPPPAAISIIRISGPDAGHVLARLAGAVPPPRRASYRTLHVPRGTVLDQALVLWFPGPNTATGEALAELHLHGGRAVVAAADAALLELGCRRAEPGEFTRRAFANGRIDLSEAEGLADLLSAETEIQRSVALAMAGGAFSRQVEDWRDRVLRLSAVVEAALDFDDEDDVQGRPLSLDADLAALASDLRTWLHRPTADLLRQGFRVVLAGPPNAGKSTLFNALVQEEAAITSPIAGTTRDAVMRSVALDGVPFLFIDTAGLRDSGEDTIEAIGIAKAHSEIDTADLVLWLGSEGEGQQGAWEIATQIDVVDHPGKASPRHRVSALTGEGLGHLRNDLVNTARTVMPKAGHAALNRRQHDLLSDALKALDATRSTADLLLLGECLRLARVAFDSLVGRAATEDVLDTLFGRFCIGK